MENGRISPNLIMKMSAGHSTQFNTPVKPTFFHGDFDRGDFVPIGDIGWDAMFQQILDDGGVTCGKNRVKPSERMQSEDSGIEPNQPFRDKIDKMTTVCLKKLHTRMCCVMQKRISGAITQAPIRFVRFHQSFEDVQLTALSSQHGGSLSTRDQT